eukprot:10918604-Karenia_brevis.AAC.1
MVTGNKTTARESGALGIEMLSGADMIPTRRARLPVCSAEKLGTLPSTVGAKRAGTRRINGSRSLLGNSEH